MRRLLDFLLPSPCLGCGRLGEERPGSLGLCRCCRGRLEVHPASACIGCGRPAPVILDPVARALMAGVSHRCELCRRSRLAYRRLHVAWTYASPLDAVILGLKFRRLDYLADGLAEGLADRIAEDRVDGDEEGFDMVAAVPLHWRRQLRRGYNQARLLARPIARRLDVPLVSCLRRRGGTVPQSRQKRKERLRSLRGRFKCHRPKRVEGQRILLVDDVVTTGATLQAAALELKRAGARWVEAAAVARTPE